MAHLSLKSDVMRQLLSTARLFFYIKEVQENTAENILDNENEVYDLASKYYLSKEDGRVDKSKMFYRYWRLQHLKPAMEYIPPSDRGRIVHYLILEGTIQRFCFQENVSLKDTIVFLLKLYCFLLDDKSEGTGAMPTTICKDLSAYENSSYLWDLYREKIKENK